jgi:hypothetical protein
LSSRQKYIDALAIVAAVAGALPIASTVTAAREEPDQQHAAVGERLAAIRQAVSEAVQDQHATTPPYRLAWGNTNPLTGQSYAPGTPWPNAIQPGFAGAGGGSSGNPMGWGARGSAEAPVIPHSIWNNWRNVNYPLGLGPNSQLDPTNTTECHFVNNHRELCSNSYSVQCRRAVAFLRLCVAAGAMGPHGE